MFESRAEAAAAFAEAFDETGDASAAMTGLVEAIRFVARSVDETGGCRLGGLPDLPVGAAWPVRPALANLDEVASRGGSTHAPHIRRYGGIDVPLPFYAQLNCAALRAVSPALTDALPPHGRLLFFYDEWIGPWGDEDVSCCVLFDDTSADQIVQLSPQQALIDLENAAQAEWAAVMAAQRLPANPLDAPTVMAPAQAVEPKVVLTALSWATVEMDHPKYDALRERLADDDFHEAYTCSSEWHGGLYEGDGGPMRLHRALSPPVPVQDDPRISAVLGGSQWASDLLRTDDGFRAKVMADAANWRVLLQIDLGSLKQQAMVEGVVYFLIATADLAAGDFSRVRAVYQQT
jgi:hypothetical protein